MARKPIDILGTAAEHEVGLDKEISQEIGNEEAGNDPVEGDSIVPDPQTDEPVVTNMTAGEIVRMEKALAPEPQDNLDDEVPDRDAVTDAVTSSVQPARINPQDPSRLGDDGELSESNIPKDKNKDETILASHDNRGYRNMFINRHGKITMMDDDTAKMFHDNPKFYAYTYDAASGVNAHVTTLEWCDKTGKGIGEMVGTSYEANK